MEGWTTSLSIKSLLPVWLVSNLCWMGELTVHPSNIFFSIQHRFDSEIANSQFTLLYKMSSLGMPPPPSKKSSKGDIGPFSPSYFFDGIPFVVEKFGAEVDHWCIVQNYMFRSNVYAIHMTCYTNTYMIWSISVTRHLTKTQVPAGDITTQEHQKYPH